VPTRGASNGLSNNTIAGVCFCFLSDRVIVSVAPRPRDAFDITRRLGAALGIPCLVLVECQVAWWSVRGHCELRCGCGVVVMVGWDGCCRLVHHTRNMRSGRRRPSGRSMRPWVRANATLSVASWTAAACRRDM
jgi:hypothetical protein